MKSAYIYFHACCKCIRTVSSHKLCSFLRSQQKYRKMTLYIPRISLSSFAHVSSSSMIRKHIFRCMLCSHASLDSEVPRALAGIEQESQISYKQNVEDQSQMERQQAEMITLLNTLPESELRMLKFMNSKIAAGIVAHRENRGAFSKMEDLIEVPGVGWKTLEKLGAQMTGRKPNKGTRIDIQSNTTADLTSERLSALRDVVSVDVGLKHVAWLHMDSERWIHKWHCEQIEGISPGKWEPLSYLKWVSSAIEDMPRADLYVLEHKSFTSLNKGTFQTMLFVRCLEAMFFTSLNQGFTDTGEVRAISLPQNAVGRHFNLLVGSQRKSGQALARALLNEGLEKRNAWFPARISFESAGYFEDSNRYVREHLANSLLRAVAFYDIYVNKKPGFKMK